MYEDMIQEHWKTMRGRAKEWWGKLTIDDLDEIDGKRDRLIRKLQQRYGYSKEKAARDVNARLKELEQMANKVHR